MRRPLLIVSQSDFLMQTVDRNSYTKWQTVQSRSVGFFRSQLIWLCTVCKCRVYSGSVGQGSVKESRRKNPLSAVHELKLTIDKLTFSGLCTMESYHIIIRFLINVQVQGQHPHQWAPPLFPDSWLAACMADLTPDLQVCLSWRWWLRASTLCNPSLSATSMSSWGSLPHAFHQLVCQRLSWLHHWSVSHVHTIGVFSPSEGDPDPQCQSAQVAHWTWWWQCLAAWHCRSVWSLPRRWRFGFVNGQWNVLKYNNVGPDQTGCTAFAVPMQYQGHFFSRCLRGCYFKLCMLKVNSTDFKYATFCLFVCFLNRVWHFIWIIDKA